jgi:CHASE3 domain sensor protein
MVNRIFKHLTVLAFVAVTVVIVILGWVLYGFSVKSMELKRHVIHALEVIHVVDGIDTQLDRAEAAHRGSLLFGTTARHQERDSAIADARTGIGKLKPLVSGSQSQELRVEQLAQGLVERTAIMRTDEQRVLAEGSTVVGELLDSGIAEKARARLNVLTGGLKQEELQLVDLQ